MLLRPSSFLKKIHFDNFLNRTSSKGGWFYRRESKIRSMHDLEVQFFFSFYQIKGGGQWTWWCTCIWSKQRWYVTCWHNMSPVRVTQRNFNFVSLAWRPMSRGPIGPYINPEPPTYMPLCLTVSKRLLLFFCFTIHYKCGTKSNSILSRHAQTKAVPAAEVVVLIDKEVQERLLREAVVACRGVIGSDTDGYCRYRICFHIFSLNSDRIQILLVGVG